MSPLLWSLLKYAIVVICACWLWLAIFLLTVGGYLTIESLTSGHKYSQEVGLSSAFTNDGSLGGEVILGNGDVVLHGARYIRIVFQTSVPESERNVAHPYFTVSSWVWVADDVGEKRYLGKGARRTGIKFRSASTRKLRAMLLIVPRALGFCDETQPVSAVVVDTKIDAFSCEEKKSCGLVGVDVRLHTDAGHVTELADAKIDVFIWRTHIIWRVLNNVGLRHLLVLTSWAWLVSCTLACMLFTIVWKVNNFIMSPDQTKKEVMKRKNRRNSYVG